MRGLQRERQGKKEQIDRLVAAIGSSAVPLPSVTDRLKEWEGIVAKIEQRLTDIDSELNTLDQNRIDLDHVTTALTDFDRLWDVVWPGERVRLVRSLIERAEVDGDGEGSSVWIGFSLRGATEALGITK